MKRATNLRQAFVVRKSSLSFLLLWMVLIVAGVHAVAALPRPAGAPNEKVRRDDVPPTATLSPADNDTGVPVAGNLELTFSEPVTVADTGTITITHGDTDQSIALSAVSLSEDGRTAVIDPAADFPYATVVEVSIPGGAFRDLTGNPYAGTAQPTVSWRFTTGAEPDTKAPTATLSPVDGAGNVSVTSNLVLTFSEPVTKGSGSITISQGSTSQNIGLGAVDLSADGLTATIDPADFPYATPVSVEVPSAAFEDAAGNPYAGTTPDSWRFTTGAEPDTQAPTATLSPGNGATNVSITSNLTLTFSEAVAKGTGSITITHGGTTQNISVGDVTLSADGLTATVDPADFPYATPVSVEVPSAAFEDEAGNPYAGTTADTWRFTTGDEPDNTAPTVTSVSPTDGAIEVPVTVNLTLSFSEPVTKGSGSIAITHGGTTQSISVNDVTLSPNGATATIDAADFPYATPVSVEVPAGAFKDAAGNLFAGLSADAWRFTTGAEPDTKAPTATLSPANGATNVSITSNLTLTFSEAVAKGTGSITITHGGTTQSISVGDVSLSPDGLTATVDPADFPYATTVSVEVPNTAFKDAANNPFAGTTADTWRFTTGAAPDTQAPTATLSPGNGATNVSITSNLTLAFSEAVIKGSGSITLTYGSTTQSISMGDVALSADGLTATINPADFPYSTTVGVTVPNTAFKDLAGNAYSGTTASTWNFTTGAAPDTQAPTATLSPANGTTSVLITSNLLLTFSEPVTKATTGSITISYGATTQTIALSSVVLSQNGLTATVDPANFPYSTSVGVTVPNTAFRDLAGNAYAGTTASSWSFTTGAAPDTQAPTATLSPANGATNVPITSNLTLTFSEPVTKATTGSITISQGASSQSIPLSSVTLSVNGLTATIDPANFPYSATVGVTVPNTAFRDLAGNAYAGTTSSTWSFTTGAAPDTQAPTATLSPANGATNVAITSNLTLTFSEPVTKGTGDITITHGAASQSIALSSVVLSANGLTATIDPANFPYSTTVGVSVPNTAFKDLAGNAYAGTTASSWSFTTGAAPDTQAPTATLSPANGATNVPITSNLILTFSEPVTKATTGSITITYGATTQTIALSSVVLSANGLTATVDPANFPYSTTVGVSVPNTAFRDLAGNAYAGTTSSTWSFTTGSAPDTQAPTATLSPANGATNVPITSNLTLTFSEPVTKGTGDITITHGATSQIIALSSVVLSVNGLTATIDAANFPYSTSVGVSVPNTAFRDLAGNAYAGTTSSTWSFTTSAAPDTQAPTATLSPANGASNVSISSNLTLTFSEPVTKATTGSITISHGATTQTIALSSVTLSVSGLTATVDPANFPYATTVAVTVPNTAFKDLAGNAYAGTTAATWSFTTGAAPDTQAPTATLSPANGATSVSITSNLVLTFSEPVTKATTGSITITHGATSQTIALSSVTLSVNGLTATIDPTNFPYSTSVGVSVPNTAFRDLAGNAYAGTTASSWSFTTGAAPDTQAPTATLSPANGATNVPISSNLVLNFSEPVTKATTGSILITYGATTQTIALSSVVLSANGLTATIDPTNFPYSTSVGVTVPNTAFRDLAGNAYAGTTASSWSFTTGSAPDTQAPTATLSPANGATNVPISSNLTLTFSEPVTKATTGSITITYGATTQTIALSSVVLSVNGLTATIDPTNFPYSTSVGVSVPNTAFRDLAGNAYAGTTSSTWSFTTGAAPDTQAPTATLSPANGATNVPITSNLVLTFSEPVTKATTGSITISHGATTQTIALSSVTLSVSGLTATVDPANFPYATTVAVTVPNTAFKDLAGNAYAGTTAATWSFTTGAAPDTQAPTATLSPANGATSVSITSNLVLTFSEPVTKATTGSITITHGATSQTIALSSVVLSVSGLTATIDPANFPYSTSVGVSVPNTAFRDLAGNAYAGTTAATWSFTTAPAPLQEIKVNFQDAATIPPAGWLRDYGQPFGTRTGTYQGTNMTYGWKKRSDGTLLDLSVGGSSNLGNGRNRNSSLDPDIDVLRATLMHMQADDLPTTFNGTRVEGYWEIKVPNGGYDVTVSAGDGVVSTDPEVYSLNAEGVNAIARFTPSGLAGSLTRFKSATARVVVSDGNLTLNADGGTNTKINSVRIVPVTTGPFLYWSATAQNVTVAQGSTAPFALQLKTSNLGTATAALSAVYGAGGSGWLSFNASQSTGTPTVDFTCQAGALPVGTYTATVTAAATGYTSAAYAVTMNVVASRPYVKGSSPADGAQNVSVSIASVVANDLYVPEVAGFKGGVNNVTLTSSTVKLLKVSNGIETQLTGIIQGTGGGDAISFTPSFALESNTTYRFVITDGVKSNSGAAFLPYQATFRTGTVVTDPGHLTGVSFKPMPQTQTEGQQYTSLAIGPDRKLYGLMLNGTIKRFPINADGSLGTPQQINTLTATYGARSAVGLVFDPAATATNPIVWVSHCSAGLTNAPSFDGNVSRLSGANLETPQLVLTRLPRSMKDHLVNGLAFGPDGALYISQGSNSSMGAYDDTWQRSESLLAGAILRLDRSKLTGLTLPLNVETTSNLTYINGASSTNMRFPDGKYNPYASTSPLTIYASGVRNAYDLLWHSNGQLYVPTNGSASGGNSPASVTGTRRPNGTFYSGPSIPATTSIQVQNDWLFRVNPAKPVGYYGHPNPLRGEYVTNRGYPDNSRYANTVTADINYRGAAYNFELNKSPNGVIEYKNGTVFGGVLKGKLLVCRFSGGSDIIVLEPGSVTKVPTATDDFIYDIVKAWTGGGTPGIPGLSGFANPLDITEDTQTGNLYVSEHAWEDNDTRPSRITLLKVNATVSQGIATVSPAKVVDNDVAGGAAGRYHTITLANTGSANLRVTSIALTGLDASQYVMVGAPAATATSPYTVLPNSAVTFSVAFNPTSTGVKTAKIQVASENNAVREVTLSGLGTKGLGGTNEPSLQQILDVHGVFVTAGDNDKTTNIINSLTPKATLLGGELRIQQFVRSNDGPVTVEVLGVFGPQSAGGTVAAFGWYPSGSTVTKNGLFTVPNSGYQTVNVPVTGTRSFDPGAATFGFYSQWPFFGNRTVYQEDHLNTFTGAIPHHLRVYPLKTSTGATVADAYVLAHEEDVAGFDYQDIAVIVRNVKPAPVKTVMIDFKPAASAAQTGYTPDNGLAYDATRGFGWIDPVTKAPKLNQAYARERTGTDELRVRTFNAMRPTSGGSASYANWEYKVLNGFYKVTVQVGDPGFYDSFHYINAEGVSVISNFVPTSTTKYRVATKVVEVKDGKLTIDATGGPVNNNTKIGYILITPATSLSGRLAADDNPEAGAAGLDVVAYPNPTAGHVTLAFTGLGAEETVAVSVISPIGVVCRQENHAVSTADGSLALDLTGLKAGTYLVKVQSGERVKLLRVVKR